MDMYLTFLAEICLSLAISSTVILLFRSQLWDVLTETCGTRQRAAFWVMFTQLMLVVAPLMLVIFFTKTGEVAAPNTLVLIKETLFRSLLGVFVGLLAVGQVIWRAITITAKSTNKTLDAGKHAGATK